MTEGDIAVLTGCAAKAAKFLMARGIERERAISIAIDIVYDALRETLKRAGLGQVATEMESIDIFAKAKSSAEIAPIKKVREAISPWLWVLSVIGFGLGLLNTRRIAKMYTDWRAKQRKKASA